MRNETIFVGWLVGWLVVLRIYVALAVFQSYLDLEAGDNQSLKFKWLGGELNPGPLAPQAKSLTTRPPPLPKPFLLKNHIFDQKSKITIIMCSDNVFTIIVHVVLDFINISRKLKKLHFITSIYPGSSLIYPNENSVNFQSCYFCKFGVLPPSNNPSIVETRKVK